MSDEERKTLMDRELAEQKHKQSLLEKEPEWSLFCDLWGNDLFTTAEYWKSHIDHMIDDTMVGDEDDRWK
jgi:hypothetical protein